MKTGANLWQHDPQTLVTKKVCVWKDDKLVYLIPRNDARKAIQRGEAIAISDSSITFV